MELVAKSTKVQKLSDQNINDLFASDLIVINSGLTSKNNNDLNLQIAAPLYSTVNSDEVVHIIIIAIKLFLMDFM